MSQENAWIVRLPGSDPLVSQLLGDIASARRRASKALPGDRTDVVRFEALSTQLERLAAVHLRQSATDCLSLPVRQLTAPASLDREAAQELPPEVAAAVAMWQAAGDAAVEVRDPFVLGPTPRSEFPEDASSPVAEVWRSPNGELGREAVARRFEEQVERAANQEAGAAIMPSGVSNTVLTDTLRSYVDAGTDKPSLVEAPVSYRDGSAGAPFPLRCLGLSDVAAHMGTTLRFALLSMRHTEMDVEVDGAWLRNTDISRTRPAGETDQLAYEITRQQLLRLTAIGPVLIYLYQTGLETAIVGFYRALVHHLLEETRSVAVVPMYFRRRTGPPARTVAGYAQESSFVEGKPWTT